MRKRRNRNRNNQKPPNKVGDNKPVAAIPTPLGSDQEKQKLDHLWLLVPILGTLFGSATGFLAKDHPIKAAWCFVIGATIILFGWAWIGKQRTQSLRWAWRLPTLLVFVLVVLASYLTHDLIESRRPPYLLPLDNSEPGKGDAVLKAGEVVFSVSSTNSMSLIRFRTKSILNLQRTDQGTLFSGEFLGPNGEVLAVIDRNRIITNAANVLEMTLTRGSLVIRDKHNELLIINHPNANTYTLSAMLRLPNGKVIKMGDEGVQYGSISYQRVGFANFSSACIQIGDGPPPFGRTAMRLQE